MAGFLLFMTLITDVILVAVALQSVVLMRRIRTEYARMQAVIVVLLCVAGLLASIQDIGFQATQLGWMSDSVGVQFVSNIQAFLVVGSFLVLVPVLIILRKLTAEFARSEAVTEALVGRLPPDLTIESAGLTKRETEVVAAFGVGLMSDSEIAEHLTVSPATAATHIRNIMRKTGIRRRADLTLLAIENTDEI